MLLFVLYILCLPFDVVVVVNLVVVVAAAAVFLSKHITVKMNF